MPSDQNRVAAACLDHWRKPGLPEETVSSSWDKMCGSLSISTRQIHRSGKSPDWLQHRTHPSMWRNRALDSLHVYRPLQIKLAFPYTSILILTAFGVKAGIIFIFQKGKMRFRWGQDWMRLYYGEPWMLGKLVLLNPMKWSKGWSSRVRFVPQGDLVE